MNRIPEIETRSTEEIRRFQFDNIVKTLQYLNLYSPFYQRLFKDRDIDVSQVTSWEAFAQLPTTSKEDIQYYNWDFLCVPRMKIIEYTSTSGTAGKPVTISLTEKDLQRLAYNEAISFACAEGNEHDLYQLMLTLDRQFMAGIAYYEGIRKLGAGLVRVGPGLPALQWETIERLKPTALVAVPSFIIKLIEFAETNGIDLKRSSVKKAICIGEAIRTPDFKLNAIGQRIQSSWDIKLFGTYASTEMQTAFTECKMGVGGHLHPELIYAELLDESGRVVPDGEAGEVTITTLGVEGMPLLRYRTGDIAIFHPEKCACKRSTSRIGPVLGRKNQMIKLKGTTLYPPAIIDIVQQMTEVRDFVVEVFKGKLDTDELRLHVLTADDKHEVVRKDLAAAFQARIRVVPEIIFAQPPAIEKLQLEGNSRKLRKFVDHRLA